MKYAVTIQRTEYREHQFQVDADSEDEACDIAMDSVCDYDFGDSPVSSADETVTSVSKAV